MAAGKGDDGLIGGFVPLDGGKSFGAKILACQKGVQNSHTVEVKSVLLAPRCAKNSGRVLLDAKVQSFFSHSATWARIFLSAAKGC